MKLRLAALLVLAGALLATGCDYTVPLTEKPTRKIEPSLLGTWQAKDKDSDKDDLMTVKQWDATSYIVLIDHDIYRVFHSDLAELNFISAQDINSKERKYSFFEWRLSAIGNELTLSPLNTEVISPDIKDSAALQKLIKKNRDNPKLLRPPLVFIRPKAAK
ncbi:MAG TPA: hypothetical protein VHD32_02045 [Candidatus Didemnitutus sp.]|nr:hypothetical protein [Candidatus Didemnitutus sp.]